MKYLKLVITCIYDPQSLFGMPMSVFSLLVKENLHIGWSDIKVIRELLVVAPRMLRSRAQVNWVTLRLPPKRYQSAGNNLPGPCGSHLSAN